MPPRLCPSLSYERSRLDGFGLNMMNPIANQSCLAFPPGSSYRPLEQRGAASKNITILSNNQDGKQVDGSSSGGGGSHDTPNLNVGQQRRVELVATLACMLSSVRHLTVTTTSSSIIEVRPKASLASEVPKKKMCMLCPQRCHDQHFDAIQLMAWSKHASMQSTVSRAICFVGLLPLPSCAEDI